MDSYRAGLRHWLPFLAAHLFTRIVVAAIVLPFAGLVLAGFLRFSDQTAVTDQDIALLLFTPAGAVGGLITASLLLVAMVLDLVVATTILRRPPSGPMAALRLAAGVILRSMPGLLRLVVPFLIRIGLIALPCLATAGGVFLLFLTDHDINYYLTERPREFLIAAGLIGLVLLALLGALLVTLSGWAIVVHLALFEGVAPRHAFAESRERMKGHRMALIVQLIGWFALRAGAGLLLSALVALLVTWAMGWRPERLANLAAMILGLGLLYAIATAWVAAVANGALANILNAAFNRALDGSEPARDVDKIVKAPGKGTRLGALILALAVFSLIGLGTGGLLAERVKDDAAVEIIGHRGAAAVAPENTMAAILRAIEDGADWIEIDVQESADGSVIVVHDSDFMKSARNPTKVWDATDDDLAQIDIGSWFAPGFADERVPRLDAVLEAARGKAGVIIELKYYGHDVDLERRVASIVEDAGMADQIAIMSLKYPAVLKMRALRPDWRIGVLAATSIGDLSGLEGDFLALNQASISQRLVQRAKAAGKDVYAWTVNDPMSIARMLWRGVDGLITDDPARTRQVAEGYAALTLAERFALALGDRVGATLNPSDVEVPQP